MPKWYEFNRRDRVRIARADDEFCDRRLFKTNRGVIEKIHYGDGGVGDTREDPYAIVTFPDGSKDGYFLTELELV
jgi:hypothetical protein